MSDAYHNDVDLQMERPQMAARCAWCGTTIRQAEPGHESDPVSHGICTPCLAKARAELAAKSSQANSELLLGALIGNGDVRL